LLTFFIYNVCSKFKKDKTEGGTKAIQEMDPEKIAADKQKKALEQLLLETSFSEGIYSNILSTHKTELRPTIPFFRYLVTRKGDGGDSSNYVSKYVFDRAIIIFTY